jgi:excisionase family DNA binding protein
MEERIDEIGDAFQRRGAFKMKEACDYLGGISPVTLRRLIARGFIRPNRAPRHIIISKAELDKFLSSGNGQLNAGRELASEC